MPLGHQHSSLTTEFRGARKFRCPFYGLHRTSCCPAKARSALAGARCAAAASSSWSKFWRDERDFCGRAVSGAQERARNDEVSLGPRMDQLISQTFVFHQPGRSRFLGMNQKFDFLQGKCQECHFEATKNVTNMVSHQLHERIRGGDPCSR